MQLIGQKSNLELINTWKDLPQFLIIQGDSHTGKKYLTLYLCQKFGLRYSLMKNSVKNVRSLIEYMSPDSNTVFHFDNFDTATLQAKNALLKITEEPIPGNYIVITGGPQIKTLESRAKRIIMSPYSFDEVEDYMDVIYTDKNKKLKLYNAGINTPAKIDFYKKYDHLDAILMYAYEIFDKITYLTPNTTISMLSRFEDRYDKDNIDACMLFLTLLINIIKYNIEQKHLYSYIDILSVLLKAKQDLSRETTLKRKMLLFKTFYTIEQINRGGVNG